MQQYVVFEHCLFNTTVIVVVSSLGGFIFKVDVAAAFTTISYTSN